MRQIFMFAALTAIILGAAAGCSGGRGAGVSVEKVADFPAAEAGHTGVAGAFVGVADDVMIIAGGSDFPGKKPWEGGSKVYYDDVWLLARDGEGYGVFPAGEKLPVALGNGCAASDGETVFCFGGNNAERSSAAVYALRLTACDSACSNPAGSNSANSGSIGGDSVRKLSAGDKAEAVTLAGRRVQIDSIAALPEGFTAVSATFCNGEVYLHGIGAGIVPEASNAAKNGNSLDASESASDGLAPSVRRNALWKFNPGSGEWTALAGCPDRVISEGAPLVALQRSLAGDTAALQSDATAPQKSGSADSTTSSEAALYLIGGRGTDDDGLYLSSTIWEYLPAQDSWTRKSDFEIDGEKATLMYSGAVPYGDSRIIVIGGDDGIEFSRRVALENEIRLCPEKEDSLRALLVEANVGHGGFCDKIFSYSPADGSWTQIGTSTHPLPVVTSAAMLDGHILLPSGEIHPGVRSSDILSITISE